MRTKRPIVNLDHFVASLRGFVHYVSIDLVKLQSVVVVGPGNIQSEICGLDLDLWSDPERTSRIQEHSLNFRNRERKQSRAIGSRGIYPCVWGSRVSR